MAIEALRGPSNGAARAEHDAAPAQHADDRARRFREAALPLLNDVYTLAHYLMRNPDACRGCGSGVLSPRLALFRQLPRPGHETVAAGDPEKFLQFRIHPAR